MNDNMKVAVFNNESIVSYLEELHIGSIKNFDNANKLLKNYVDNYKNDPIDIIFIKEELDLLNSIIEINPKQYCVLITKNTHDHKIMDFIRAGGSGVVSEPVTVHKIQMEVEKYKYLCEDQLSKRVS